MQVKIRWRHTVFIQYFHGFLNIFFSDVQSKESHGLSQLFTGDVFVIIFVKCLKQALYFCKIKREIQLLYLIVYCIVWKSRCMKENLSLWMLCLRSFKAKSVLGPNYMIPYMVPK